MLSEDIVTNQPAKVLAPVLSLNVIESSIIPMMQKLTNDDIPNIRFNVAKSFAVIIDVLKRLPEQGTIYELEKADQPTPGSQHGLDLIAKEVLPNLEKLQQDDDVDVRYFATTAAQSYTEGADVMHSSP